MGFGYKYLWLSYAKQNLCADIPNLNWNECYSNIYENEEIIEEKDNYKEFNLLLNITRKLSNNLSLGLDVAIGLNPDFLGFMSELYFNEDKQLTFTRTYNLNLKYDIK